MFLKDFAVVRNYLQFFKTEHLFGGTSVCSWFINVITALFLKRPFLFLLRIKDLPDTCFGSIQYQSNMLKKLLKKTLET